MVGTVDCRPHFEHGRSGPTAAYAARANGLLEAQYLSGSVEKGDVEQKAHAPGVHGPAPGQQQTPSRDLGFEPGQAEQPCERVGCHGNIDPENLAPRQPAQPPGETGFGCAGRDHDLPKPEPSRSAPAVTIRNVTSGDGRGAGSLLERDKEIESILLKLDAAGGGAGSLLVLEGPAGIGKTALLDAARSLAAERGFAVLSARGGLLERTHEWGVVRQLVERTVIGADDARREELLSGPAAAAGIALGLREPALDGGPGYDATADILHGLHWLVANLAAERPQLLIVDDAHWGDPSSLRAGGYLAQRLDGMPALMIVGVRNDEPGPAATVLREMLATSNPTYLRPEPLGRGSASDLIAAAFAGAEPSRELTEACVRASGGNPFFLTELVAELSRQGRGIGEVSADAVDRAGPVAVRHSLLLRIGQLGPEARGLAEAVAILGGEGELAHAAAIAELGREEAGRAADRLAVAGILDSSRTLQIKHPIVRAAIEDDLGPAAKARAHRRALEALRRGGADEETLATHALWAEVGTDGELTTLLRRAADRALRTGNAETAAIYLRRALEEGEAEEGGDQQARAQLLVELGRAEVRGGDFAGGLAHLDAAIERLGEPAARLAALRDRAFATFAGSGMDPARDLVAGALADLEEQDRRSDAALQLQADVALLDWLSGGDPKDELEPYRRIAGETAAERTILALLAQRDLCAGGDPDSAVALAERALAGGRMIAEDSSESLGWYLATYALLAAEALGPARITIAEAIADGHRRGSAFARAGALGCRAVLALNEGRPRDAEADARAAADGGLPPTMVLANSAYIAIALVDQGDPEGAWQQVVEGGFEQGPGGPTVLRFAPWARARIHELRGEVAETRADLDPLIADEQAGMPMPALTWRPLLARTLARDGQTTGPEIEEARQLAAEHLEWAQRWGRPAALGIARRAVALTAPPEQRVDLLLEAVASLSASPNLAEEGRARADLGVCLLRAGRRKDGRAELERALPIVHEVGDRPLAERIADELEIAGASPKRLRFDEMTAAERRVAMLAAEGPDEPGDPAELFVTPKTVENHLTRVYSKLGVGSRKDLAGAL